MSSGTDHFDLDVKDGKTSTVTFVTTTFVSSFSGWHLSTSNALHQKTHAAYAVNAMKQEIIAPSKDRHWEHKSTPGYGEDRMNLLLLRPNGAVVASNMDRRYVFFKPLCVNVKGPRVNAIPTMCKVKNYYLKTGLYTILMVKADGYAKQMMEQHEQETALREGKPITETYTPIEQCVRDVAENISNHDDVTALVGSIKTIEAQVDTSTTELATSEATLATAVASSADTTAATAAVDTARLALANRLTALEEEQRKLLETQEPLIQKSIQISESAGTFLLAMRVRHMCDNDAGAAFRDKRGREGAAAEVETACHHYLSLMYKIK